MSASQFVGLIGVEGGVDASKHHVGAALAGQFPDFVAAERVGGVDADADNIAGLNLIQQAPGSRPLAGSPSQVSPRCKHIQPARGCDRRLKLHWVDGERARDVASRAATRLSTTCAGTTFGLQSTLAPSSLETIDRRKMDRSSVWRSKAKSGQIEPF
jgi:hypothetical protein